MLVQIANFCDAINEKIGQAIKWLSLFMVIVMSINVLMRYLFAMGDPWQQELVRFMHAMLFLLGAGYALKHDAHVRVDVLYQGFSDRAKAIVNLTGTLLLLFPVAIALIYFSYGYVVKSWEIFEGSSEYKGMPGVFLLKTSIWICGSVLIIQGISTICHSIRAIRGEEKVISEEHVI